MALTEAMHVLLQLKASGPLSEDECSSVQTLLLALGILEDAVNTLSAVDTHLGAIKTLVTTADEALLMKVVAFRSLGWPRVVAASERAFASTDASLESVMQRCSSMCALAETISINLLGGQELFHEDDILNEISSIQQKRVSVVQMIEEIQRVLRDLDELESLDGMVQGLNIANAF
ncbi:hypothetical protein PF005_g6821 [Phytophthora fragariae]|uniref:Uncharacterized protein n=3 Tax=Phytophthora fragariae TaxID=53985 RepID=A0A6A3YRF8_9STRA|nr:hypothetical protein PF003_g9954 [Phytophthora fragariae]KAE8945322.1 hypothetical protein PF009_g5006 [Phytophthora fragariae]KAE9117635.1 hypothetical protein PF007_g9198 [Phytophthora fragariae]KAE9222131.1 hypothetical protein PF005_g6821 [Phytophthora fragariae]KAE9232809.1 hypothetical protein PF004_g9809 [Phytophthora fragariae]